MECIELSQTLLELVGYEANQVKCSIVNGTVRNCNRSSNTLRCSTQLCEVDSLF